MRALYEELYDRLSRDLMMIRFEIYSKNDERVMELIGDIKGLPGFSGGLRIKRPERFRPRSVCCEMPFRAGLLIQVTELSNPADISGRCFFP